MVYDFNERFYYDLSNLPQEPPSDPFERAAIRQRRAVLRGHDAPERHTDPATAASTIASVAAGFLPLAGVVEAFGYMPDFEGGYEPSLRKNVQDRNYLASGLQLLGAVPVVGGPAKALRKGLSTQRTATRRSVPEVGKYSKYAENYPPVDAPLLYDKVTGRQLQVSSQADADALVAEGKAFRRKNLPPETQEFAEARRAVERDMKKNGYPPFFNPAERADVDPRNYPGWKDVIAETWPKRPETREKFQNLYVTEDAKRRLIDAHRQGVSDPNSAGILFLKQVEDEYVKLFGPEQGRHLFRTHTAGAIAAASAGLSPKQNALMAHFLIREHMAGRPLPRNVYEMPYPIGGQFPASNSQSVQRFLETGEFGSRSPKQHEYYYGMLGEPNVRIIDSRASGAILPGMRAPAYYAPAAEVMSAAQKEIGAPDARTFVDAVWHGRGKPGHDDGPLINTLNGVVERTHRLTGIPREQVFKEGWLLKKLPLYGVGAAMFAPALGYGLSTLPDGGSADQ